MSSESSAATIRRASSFSRTQSAAVLAAVARSLGADEASFDSQRLTFVHRPPEAVWPYLLYAVSTPEGTVASVDAVIWEAATALAPASHADAAASHFLAQIREAAIQSHSQPAIAGPAIGWTLSMSPPDVPLPPGLATVRRDSNWMAGEQGSGRFPNGVGRPGHRKRDGRNRFCVAILDTTGEPIAVAGVLETFGLDEIGVDVVAGWRGHHLAAAAVTSAVREILAQERTPLYMCDATNVISQRTALSVGFLPLFAAATIS